MRHLDKYPPHGFSGSTRIDIMAYLSIFRLPPPTKNPQARITLMIKRHKEHQKLSNPKTKSQSGIEILQRQVLRR